jgi:hypothetical protein
LADDGFEPSDVRLESLTYAPVADGWVLVQNKVSGTVAGTLAASARCALLLETDLEALSWVPGKRCAGRTLFLVWHYRWLT